MPSFASMLFYVETILHFNPKVVLQILTSVYFCKINLWFVVFYL